MKYKIYSAELKIALINEYQSRNITMRAFAKEKDVALSTFESWLLKARKYGQPSMPPAKKGAGGALIDVTHEAKSIAVAGGADPRTFTLEAMGVTLRFSLSDLKEVLGAIRDD